MTRQFNVLVERDAKGTFMATVLSVLAATPRHDRWIS